jgi:aspartyl-tRNA(Asn)/glutamyl-tRNA(Gln) amidotransferase subunit A
MSRPIAEDTIRATLLAGTVAAPSGPARDLPKAWEGTPEPGYFERDFAALAPRVSPVAMEPPSPPETGRRFPLHLLGVGDLQTAYRSGQTDPVAVLAALHARIATHPTGKAAILAMIEGREAMAEDSALRIREGRARPLEGIPIGVKDIIDVRDTPVTCGSFQTKDRVAGSDAEVVARLRNAGAIPVAMLATTEFACGSALNPRYGAVPNPWDKGRWTGGSSTGSGAMLAARMLPLALGTDTGGSIRIPAAWCGVTGLKPTRGLVPRTGVAPLSWTLDHIGPMARSVDDLARVMPLIAGPDGMDPTAVGVYDTGRARPDIMGLRIGVPAGWFVTLQDDAVLTAWQAALATLEGLGGRLVPIDLGDIAGPHADGYLVLMSELASLQEPTLDTIDLFDVGTRARLEQGQAFSATAYLRALRRRPVVLQRMLKAMDAVDVLVTPGPGGEAAFLEDLTVAVDRTRHPLQLIVPRNTMIFDYTGMPALMLPSGLGTSGLPVAIQIVGKPYDDALCLSVGAAFQTATTFHLNAPPEPEPVAS